MITNGSTINGPSNGARTMNNTRITSCAMPSDRKIRSPRNTIASGDCRCGAVRSIIPAAAVAVAVVAVAVT